MHILRLSMKELKQKYQHVIDKITTIYSNHKTINDYGDNPDNQLQEYMSTLNAIEALNDKPNYDLALRTFIKQLKCFRWRFVNKNNAGDVWNPLYEPYDIFVKRTGGNIDFWFADKPFPSEEIIENWIKSYAQNPEVSQKIVHRPAR